MKQKIEKKFFSYRVACRNFTLFRRGYLSSAVNVLTNSPKISDVTKRGILQFDSAQSDGRI